VLLKVKRPDCMHDTMEVVGDTKNSLAGGGGGDGDGVDQQTWWPSY